MRAWIIATLGMGLVACSPSPAKKAEQTSPKPAALSLPPSVTSEAENWVKDGEAVGPDGEQMTFFVDMDQTTAAGPHTIKTWLKENSSPPSQGGVAEVLSYEKIGCDTKMHADISMVYYDKKGHILNQTSGSADNEEPIIPESYLDLQLPFLCAVR